MTGLDGAAAPAVDTVPQKQLQDLVLELGRARQGMETTLIDVNQVVDHLQERLTETEGRLTNAIARLQDFEKRLNDSVGETPEKCGSPHQAWTFLGYLQHYGSVSTAEEKWMAAEVIDDPPPLL